MKTRIFMASIFAIALAAPASAQLRFDAASGDYFVRIVNDSGQQVELRVVPPNKVQVVSTITVTPQTNGWLYRYAIDVAAGSPQELSFVEVDCPPNASMTNLTVNATTVERRLGWNVMQDRADRPSCSFERRATALPPGGRMEGSFIAPLLPAPGELRVFGRTPGVNWPTEDPRPENDAARVLVQSVDGTTGGWKTTPFVVPARDPGSFASAADVVRAVTGDLSASCDKLAWIMNAGVCNSLQTKLRAAADALARGNTTAARNQLRSFSDELDAQNGAEPGKHVSAAAYALLQPMVMFALSKL